MSNTVNLEFAGDASKLAQASKKAEQATKGVGDAVMTASDDFKKAGKGSDDFLTKVGKLGAGVDGMSTAIDDASGTLDALNEIQQASANRSARQARALNDVEQAQQDANQAVRDSKQALIDVGQAQIDAEQANLDAATAQKDYNKAVKEHGANSSEARQASIDLKQAQQDLKQANEDGKQAQEDGNQAVIDAKGAQLDLNDAQKEAHPPDLAKWSEQIQTYAPLLSGLVGVMGLVTAAQWAWNLAQLASPTTWIILAIVALVAIIVVIATKTQWFQKAWSASWKWIKSSASNVWEWLKKVPGWIEGAFKKISGYITRPFKAAFNYVADAWNNTIGALSFTFPGWIPGIGGNSISVPHIPKFHTGGVVPGVPGSETLAILQAGERVTPASGSGGHAEALILGSDGSRLGELLVEVLSTAVKRRGGNVQTVLGNGRG
jgi:hypothetical protein